MRTCALEGCETTFEPKKKDNYYCTPGHGKVASNRRLRRTQIDASPADAKPELSDRELMRLAEGRGLVVYKPEPQEPVEEFDTSRIRGSRVKVAVVSDTHLGSKYQQPTLLRDFMKYAKSRGVSCFIHGGDFTDGPYQMHLGAIHEQWCSTLERQVEYAAETFPDVGKPTYAISGNHDESYLKNAGMNPVKLLADQRSDIKWIGQSQGYVRFGDVLLRVDHPHDGSSYALSYKLQKRIESLSPENKPHILCLGNYHKVAHVPGYRNVEGFILPSFQAQTAFMASKALASYVGGLILEFGVMTKGLAPSLITEWVMFREPLQHDHP